MPTLEDNWSLVIPEAMACGLPVATTYYNGCYPELIQEGKNGFVFDSLRQEDILRTLKAFKQMDLKAMGRESQRIEQDFSTQVVAGRIFNSLKDFFERSKRNS
jgi:glycosyltransferase involved in cell wall biosynthesis